MVKRKIIRINEDLCDGCGQCIPSCQEGALKIIDGKAKLVKKTIATDSARVWGNAPAAPYRSSKRPSRNLMKRA